MKISTEKKFYKLLTGEKAFGAINFNAKVDNNSLSVIGNIMGDYDAISNFNSEKIMKALELLFDEKVKECDKELVRCVEGF